MQKANALPARRPGPSEVLSDLLVVHLKRHPESHDEIVLTSHGRLEVKLIATFNEPRVSQHDGKADGVASLPEVDTDAELCHGRSRDVLHGPQSSRRRMTHGEPEGGHKVVVRADSTGAVAVVGVLVNADLVVHQLRSQGSCFGRLRQVEPLSLQESLQLRDEKCFADRHLAPVVLPLRASVAMGEVAGDGLDAMVRKEVDDRLASSSIPSARLKGKPYPLLGENGLPTAHTICQIKTMLIVWPSRATINAILLHRLMAPGINATST